MCAAFWQVFSPLGVWMAVRTRPYPTDHQRDLLLLSITRAVPSGIRLTQWVNLFLKLRLRGWMGAFSGTCFPWSYTGRKPTRRVSVGVHNEPCPCWIEKKRRLKINHYQGEVLTSNNTSHSTLSLCFALLHYIHNTLRIFFFIRNSFPRKEQSRGSKYRKIKKLF